ncbi:hypothetical protein [Phenylobacterium montanum]|uniref:Uncharacterized protein n=1 Tax=Phenylobacterium montanum TaxID=2823693 RepID=A0A975G279_9CAUL|nr:hypothetical protein [Caulobacter sp. S6]QUD89530.1 hypothetical protein KCG34_06515 [Caulobacter sp. S6]
MPAIRRDVALMLAQADIQLADAEAKLFRGSDREKMQAAGKLAFLKRQKEMLERRIEEIDRHPEASETLFQWIKEESFALSVRLESWIANA